MTARDDGRSRLTGVTVVVCRDDAPDDDVSAALVRAGAVVVPLPLMQVVLEHDAIDGLVRALARAPDVVALTSRHAVSPVAAAVRAAGGMGGGAGGGSGPLAGPIVAAVGARTARIARAAGLRAEVEGDAGGEALAGLLVARGVRRVLFPRARDANDALALRLRDAGVLVDEVVVYRSIERADAAVVVHDAWARTSAPRAVVVTSPQRARLLLRQAAPDDVVVVAIGATTAAALVEQGGRVDAIAARPDADAVVEAVVDAAGSGMLHA